MKRLDAILERLDNSETSIDALGKDVKEGVQLIKDLTEKLNEVDTEVRDAFKDLNASVPKAATEAATADEDE
jgi:exodeoxyribonuclease VII small subunit